MVTTKKLEAGRYQVETPRGVYTIARHDYWQESYAGWTWVLTCPDGSWTVHETKAEAIGDIDNFKGA